MYRFLLGPRWVGFHLLVVAAIITMVNLGFWQLRRLDDRQAFNADVEASYDQPPLSLDDVVEELVESTPSDLEWRPVEVSGTYLPDETVFVVNRSQGGRAGRNVVVPLLLDDGRILLVNRGFVPLADDPPAVPGTVGSTVEVTGRVRPSQQRGLGQLTDPADGDLVEVQRIDLDRLAPQLPGDVVPFYVDLSSSSPPERTPYPEPVAAPRLGEGNHLSYAVQWFVFATAVAIGWVLAVRRSLASR